MQLWMRWVNFCTLRDLLLLVAESPAKLRPLTLERLGLEKQILVGRGGKPLGPTSRYHHRRTLERLGLIRNKQGSYVPDYHVREVGILTSNQTLGAPLGNKEKGAFGSAALRNKDCYEAFFRLFLQESDDCHDVTEFIGSAKPVELRFDRHTMTREPTVIMRQRGSATETVARGVNAVQAVHFGLRSWCVDQLSFMDEIYQVGAGYTLFPIDLTPSADADRLESGLLGLMAFHDDWATARVGDLALEAGITFRVPIAKVKSIIERWLSTHPSLVAGIPTNERFITGGLTARQREAVLKGFAQERGGALISHIRVHRELADLIKRRATEYDKH